MTDSAPTRPVDAPRWEPTVLVVGLLLPTAITYAYFIGSTGFSGDVQRLVYAVGKCVQFLLPVVWICGFLGRRESLRPNTARGWMLGIASGLLIAALMGLCYVGLFRSSDVFADAAEQIQQKVSDLGCDTPLRFLLLGLFYCLVHSLLEEYYWRWFVFGRLRAWLPFGAAMVISSLGFMAHHVLVLSAYFGVDSLATWFFSIAVAVGGGFWAWLYEKSGTLYPSWVSHMLVDAAIFLIGAYLIFGPSATPGI